MNEIPKKLAHQIATAEGMWQAERHKREQSDSRIASLKAHIDAYARQLRAAAVWAEQNGHPELLRVMLAAARDVDV